MGVLVTTLFSEGKPVDPSVELVSLEIHRELNRIPEATLVVRDGSVAKRDFELSNTGLFSPGKAIAIALRHEGESRDTILFAGLVVRQAVEGRPECSLLRVALKDRAFALTRQRKSAVFRDQNDADVIRTLLKAACPKKAKPDVDKDRKLCKLRVGTIDDTKIVHEELVQHHASDWDFMVSRAEVQSMAVLVDCGAISVRSLALSKETRLTLEYGGNVCELDLEIDAGQQWVDVSSVGWDAAEQTSSAPEPASQPKVQVGNLDAGKLTEIANQLGGRAETLLHPAALNADELKSWADARLLRSRLALLRGHAIIGGHAAVAPLDTVGLAGIGENFNGSALVSVVIHRVDRDGWKTELRLGLSPEWFAQRPDIADVPAGGMLPPVTGLQIATVAPFEADPRGEHRIKIDLPTLDATQGSVWARMARPDAGKDRGHVFWPEPGDEVVVGFLQNDPRQAIVLGSLHGSANAPPPVVGGPSEANSKRAMVSRAGSIIGFDDEQNTITIESPGKAKIFIDDKAKAVTIADQNGNTLVMDKNGITLTSKGNFTIEASKAVVIKGKTVDVQ